jgi:hypothetical protein
MPRLEFINNRTGNKVFILKREFGLLLVEYEKSGTKSWFAVDWFQKHFTEIK